MIGSEVQGNLRVNLKLHDRVTIVTGSAGGIGRAIALAMAQAGARVVVSDTRTTEGKVTVDTIRAAGGEAIFVACDVSNSDQVSRLVTASLEHFGRLDVLINNAGISGGSSLAHELELETWDKVMAVNLRGPFLCAKYALPHLISNGAGVIINIASTYGLIGAPLAPAYCASKAGVVNLTRQLAVDYGPHKIRVNAICPGYVETDMGGFRTSLPPEESAAANARREANAALQPIGRQAQALEIARVAVFLACDESSFMTGSILTVDGGCTATFNHGH
jgi:NAD(P)-dependent dehydrogenase (short-subunit alcohol dehydrogenase family)